MRDSFLPFAPPDIGQGEIDEVIDTLRSEWLTSGPKVKRFEAEFADSVGAPGALALNSGTAALHAALLAMGIGEGDVVVTSTMTFCSSVHVIEHTGATPQLADVDPLTLNLDPSSVEQAIAANARGRVAALMPVHLYGHPCEMDTLHAIARDHDLAVVEDAAHALPSAFRGNRIGSLEEGPEDRVAACFSFYATKNITTGEGGMLVGSPSLLEEARGWSLHGMSKNAYRRYEEGGSWAYDVVRPGFKYNMADVPAALGIRQLARLPAFHHRRREIAKAYFQGLSSCPALELPTAFPHVDHSWHIYALRLHLDRLSIPRDRFIQELYSRNIGTSVHFIPVHMFEYYRNKYGYLPNDFPVAATEFERLVSLPIYPTMSDEDVDSVIEAVLDVSLTHRR